LLYNASKMKLPQEVKIPAAVSFLNRNDSVPSRNTAY